MPDGSAPAKGGKKPAPKDLIKLGYELAMRDVSMLYNAVMEKQTGEAKAFEGKETPEEEALEHEEMEGAEDDAEESSDKVTAPKKFKPAPGKKPEELAYISETETAVLKDMRGKEPVKKGPKGIPSFDIGGDGSIGGGDWGSYDSGPTSTADNGQGGITSIVSDDNLAPGIDQFSAKSSDDTLGLAAPAGTDESLFGPMPVGRDARENAAITAAREAGVFGGKSTNHDPAAATQALNSLAALGLGSGKDSFNIGPSVQSALQAVLGFMPVTGVMTAPTSERAAGRAAGMIPGLGPLGFLAALVDDAPLLGAKGNFGTEDESTAATGLSGGSPISGVSSGRGASAPSSSIEGPASGGADMASLLSQIDRGRSIAGVPVGSGEALNPGALRAVLRSMGRPYPNQRMIG